MDGDKAYPVAIWELKDEKSISTDMPLRVRKYVKNMIGQDHQFIKKRIRNMFGFKSWRTATKMIVGIETIYMVKKGQLKLREQSVENQNRCIHQLFRLTA